QIDLVLVGRRARKHRQAKVSKAHRPVKWIGDLHDVDEVATVAFRKWASTPPTVAMSVSEESQDSFLALRNFPDYLEVTHENWSYAARRIAMMSSRAMWRVAAQMLVDATRERNSAKPADVTRSTDFAPSNRFSRKRPVSCAPAIPGMAPAPTISKPCRSSKPR